MPAVAAEGTGATDTVEGVELNLASIEVAEGSVGDDRDGATGATNWAAEEAVGTAAAAGAAAEAALPMPKILADDFGILATLDTVAVGAGFASAGAAESVEAGAAPADDAAAGRKEGAISEERHNAEVAEKEDVSLGEEKVPKTGKPGII